MPTVTLSTSKINQMRCATDPPDLMLSGSSSSRTKPQTTAMLRAIPEVRKEGEEPARASLNRPPTAAHASAVAIDDLGPNSGFPSRVSPHRSREQERTGCAHGFVHRVGGVSLARVHRAPLARAGRRALGAACGRDREGDEHSRRCSCELGHGDSLMVTMYDVAVVGAGPAGATAALTLARRGLSVALLERDALPRYKTCGGGLVGRALEHPLHFRRQERERAADEAAAACLVAGERVALEQGDREPASGEGERGGRARGAGANDSDVVHGDH